MKGKIIGAFILAVVMAAGAFFYWFSPSARQALDSPSRVVVKGPVGGEKTGFLDDPAVKKLLLDKYGIVIDYKKVGSIEMARANPGDADFLFPSSPVGLEIFKATWPGKLQRSETVFNSPIVLYSWDKVADGLVKAGIAQKVDNTYFIVDFPRLVSLVAEGKKWSDIGVTELYGRIVIFCTDPNKSNSGNQYAALLANVLHGDVVDEASLGTVMPTVKQVFTRIGYMEASSSDLFEQYTRTGMGSKPLVVGYENQIIEFAIENPAAWQQVKDKVRILYPVPTVWSAHPLMALTPNGEKLIKALSDEEVQKIAWEKHGLRTGVIGVQNDPQALGVGGIPKHIDKVVPMPTALVMEHIIQALSDTSKKKE